MKVFIEANGTFFDFKNCIQNNWGSNTTTIRLINMNLDRFHSFKSIFNFATLQMMRYKMWPIISPCKIFTLHGHGNLRNACLTWTMLHNVVEGIIYAGRWFVEIQNIFCFAFMFWHAHQLCCYFWRHFNAKIILSCDIGFWVA